MVDSVSRSPSPVTAPASNTPGTDAALLRQGPGNVSQSRGATGLIDRGQRARGVPTLRQAPAERVSRISAKADDTQALKPESANDALPGSHLVTPPELLQKKTPGAFAEGLFERASWSTQWKDLIGDMKKEPGLKAQVQTELTEWFDYFEHSQAQGLRVGQQLDELKALKPTVKNDAIKGSQMFRNIDNLRRRIDEQVDSVNTIKTTASKVTGTILQGVEDGDRGGKILRYMSEAEAAEIKQLKTFKQLRKQGVGGSFEEHKWFFTDASAPPVQSKKVPRLLEIDVPAQTFAIITAEASNLPTATQAAFRVKDGSGVEQLEKGAFGVHREGLQAFSQLLNSPKVKWRIS